MKYKTGLRALAGIVIIYMLIVMTSGYQNSDNLLGITAMLGAIFGMITWMLAGWIKEEQKQSRREQQEEQGVEMQQR
jgi:hypothetical protein